MKLSKKIMLLTSCALAIFALAACGTNQKQSKEKKETSTVQKSSSDKEHYKGTYSNLNSKASVEDVRTLLSAYLDQESVDKFLGLVTDYDNIVVCFLEGAEVTRQANRADNAIVVRY